ncbi:hypothetical protein [Rhizosphaericola mali]|uniref:Uncharacterized protein n=1 Tax=Rhizosphaericola mali TaxID=2545455 RepID=A0A5P2G8S5_9BACT|nr:hypothetical protein [Rhizosphaericola mali]QES90332.1 hypothetical protein E0W69_017295 [Rhizosphaericola mali]
MFYLLFPINEHQKGFSLKMLQYSTELFPMLILTNEFAETEFIHNEREITILGLPFGSVDDIKSFFTNHYEQHEIGFIYDSNEGFLNILNHN